MTIHRIWNDLAQDDSGQDLNEYAMITGLIGVTAIAALNTIATKISTLLGNVQTNLGTYTGGQ